MLALISLFLHLISQFILRQEYLVDKASTRKKKIMFIFFLSLETIKTEAYPEKF